MYATCEKTRKARATEQEEVLAFARRVSTRRASAIPSFREAGAPLPLCSQAQYRSPVLHTPTAMREETAEASRSGHGDAAAHLDSLGLSAVRIALL